MAIPKGLFKRRGGGGAVAEVKSHEQDLQAKYIKNYFKSTGLVTANNRKNNTPPKRRGGMMVNNKEKEEE